MVSWVFGNVVPSPRTSHVREVAPDAPVDRAAAVATTDATRIPAATRAHPALAASRSAAAPPGRLATGDRPGVVAREAPATSHTRAEGQDGPQRADGTVTAVFTGIVEELGRCEGLEASRLRIAART